MAAETVTVGATATSGDGAAMSPNRRAVVEAINLTKRYGNRTAVEDLSMTLYEGEIFGLLGPNGAGKTTTVLMLLGLTEPSGGQVRVLGADPLRDPLTVKSQVGYLPENIGFYDDMTGYDNLLFTARLNGLTEDEARPRIESLLEMVGLQEASRRPVRVYSRGMRQRLGLADVLVKKPRLIILDEPTLGIDPAGIREILQLIARLAEEERVAVLLSSHLLHQVQQICHRVGILVGGRLIAQGTVDDLSRQLAGAAAAEVEVEVAGDSEKAVTVLRGLEDVQSVRQLENQGALLVQCRKDVRAEIARSLVGAGLSLVGMRLRTYALDDIYHLYFKGGATNGRSTNAPGARAGS